MRLARCLASCLFLLAAGILIAEPTLRTALLPDAELIISSDKSLAQTPFVKGIKKDILNTIKSTCYAKSDILKLLDEQLLKMEQGKEPNNSFLFSLAFSPIIEQNIDTPDFSKLKYCLAIQSDTDMTEDFTTRINEEAAKENGNTIIQKITFRDGWLAYEITPRDSQELKSIVALVPGGKMLLLAPRAILEEQLDAPAGPTELVKQYYEKDRRQGPSASIALLVSPQLAKAMKNAMETSSDQAKAAKFAKIYAGLLAFKVIALSATGKDDCAMLYFDVFVTDPAMAQQAQTTLDQNYLPMIPILASSFLNGKQLPVFNTFKASTQGTHTCIEARLVLEDIKGIIDFAKARVEQTLLTRAAAAAAAEQVQESAAQ